MLKNKIEALLFSSGKRMAVDELAKLTHSDIDKIKEALQQLKWDYEQKHTSLMVVEEGNFWKITIKEEHLLLVKNIVTETELSKTLMETLAVIAFKYPIKQSELIKMRTNKAYDHLKELEETGYIIRQKYGRTKLIRLTQKFFEYFSLSEEKLKEEFKDFQGLANAIEAKEGEIKKINEEQKKRAEEFRKEKEKMEKATLEVVDEPEEIEEEEAKGVEVAREMLGSLEVVDVSEITPRVQKTSGQSPLSNSDSSMISEHVKNHPTKGGASKIRHPSQRVVFNEPEEGTDAEIKEKTPEEELPKKLPKQKEIFKGTKPEKKPEKHEEEEESDVDKRVDEILNPESEEKIEPAVEKEMERMLHPQEEEEEQEEKAKKEKSEEEAEKKQSEDTTKEWQENKEENEEEQTEEEQDKESEEPEDLLESEMKEEKKKKEKEG